jgi:protein O-GlcNAc transferase
MVSSGSQIQTDTVDNPPKHHADAIPVDRGGSIPTPSTPNPFASTLSRDALLAYAYHLYHSTQPRHTGLTPAPLVDTLPLLTSPEQIYRLRLLPVLAILRSLRPNDLSILLLLACTYHSLGDYDSCLSISQDMLRINPDCVSSYHKFQ